MKGAIYYYYCTVGYTPGIYFTIFRMLCCPLCGIHQSKNLSDLMRHIRLFHADEPNFKIDCTLQGCCRSYKNYHTYRNHIYAFHSTSSGDLDIQQSEVTTVSESQESGDESEADVSDHDDSDPHQPSSEAVSIQRSAAVWTLKVRDVHGLPQSTTESIIKDVDTLYQVFNNTDIISIIIMTS